MRLDLKVQNLDHLGIIAGVVDELGIVEQINRALGEDPRERVSAGVVVKAMILNGLGFVSSPLYLFGQWFEGKATEHLLGEGVLPEHLNDDRLGRVLDQMYLSGLSSLFVGICREAAQRYDVKRGSAHLDSSSFGVEGAYEREREVVVDGAVQPIAITHGYSRDRRPDLKQFVMNLVCWEDGDLPAFLEIGDGNQSDKARFAQLLQDFRKEWDFEGLVVADSALYSEENLETLRGMRWLTRVPLTLKAASDLVSEIDESAFKPADERGYRRATVCSTYGGIPQRWIVIESSARKEADLRQWEKTLAQATRQAQAQLNQVSAQSFACDADARTALETLGQTLPWHNLDSIRVEAKAHYAKRGKPKPGTLPTRITYHPTASLVLQSSRVDQPPRRAGRFILATNGLESQELSETDALYEYKAQQADERGF
jgi:transposase